jgi:hypothetical protein
MKIKTRREFPGKLDVIMDGVVKWGLKDGTCGNVGGNPGYIFDDGFDGGGSGHPEQ